MRSAMKWMAISAAALVGLGASGPQPQFVLEFFSAEVSGPTDMTDGALTATVAIGDSISGVSTGGGFHVTLGFFAADDVIIAPTCPADINGDQQVNVSDLLAVINAWGACQIPCPADINGDTIVNVADLLAVINTWGTCQ